MNGKLSLDSLTKAQRTLVVAMWECDSISSERHSLAVLHRLEAKGWAEAFDCEPSYLKGVRRQYVWFTLTDDGIEAIKDQLHQEVK